VRWQKVKLGALYEVHNGLSKSRDSFGSGFPFLSYSTVFNNFFLPDELDSLVMTDEKEQSSYSIKEGDVFITRTSETSDELGMSCVALKDYPHATYNGFCKRLRPITKEVFPRYIGYYLRAPEFRSRFDGLGAAMITRASLKNEDLLAMTVALPSLLIQRKIAEILGAYDDLIENNRRRIALLEKIARSIYRDWFVNFGHWGGECPSGIAKGELNDLVSRIGTGLNPRKNFILGHGENYYVTIKNMSDNTVVLDDKCAKVDDEAIARINRRSDLRAGDLLFSGIGTIGRVALIQETPRNWNTSESVFNLRPANDVPSEYLYCVLTADDVQAYAKSHALGVAQQGIRMADLKTCPVLVPSREILEKFASIVGPYLNLQYSLRQSVRNLARQRDRLLPRLLSGKLDVSKLVKEGV